MRIDRHHQKQVISRRVVNCKISLFIFATAIKHRRQCNVQWTEHATEHKSMLLHLPPSLFNFSFFRILWKNILENILFAFQLRNVMSCKIFIRNSKKPREREKFPQSSYHSNWCKLQWIHLWLTAFECRTILLWILYLLNFDLWQSEVQREGRNFKELTRMWSTSN